MYKDNDKGKKINKKFLSSKVRIYRTISLDISLIYVSIIPNKLMLLRHHYVKWWNKIHKISRPLSLAIIILNDGRYFTKYGGIWRVKSQTLPLMGLAARAMIYVISYISNSPRPPFPDPGLIWVPPSTSDSGYYDASKTWKTLVGVRSLVR